jgi:spore coat protein H
LGTSLFLAQCPAQAALGGTGNAGAVLFARPTLLRFEIELAPGEAASLRREPRRWVPARVKVEGQELTRVGVHLKGMEGSFRPLDGKPCLTLSFGRFNSGQRLFGLRKIYLNNSAQDPTYQCEDLSGELFRRAGVPAPRTAWATVALNGRPLGLYVLKEGFSKEFLGLYFPATGGNLYDGGLHHEINEPLELDFGDGPRDRADLQTLTSAAQCPDPAARWTRLQVALDVDRFVSFMAMEVLANHIDGYCLMQNNYRIYFNPTTTQAVFLPHGMDRMFGEPEARLDPPMRALVANALMTTPNGQSRYRQRLGELATQVFQPAWMTNRISEVVRLLAPVDPLVEREAKPLQERILKRAAWVQAQSSRLSATPAAP